MTGYDVRTRCQSCGTWYWAGLGHTCPTVLLIAPPGPDPADLPAVRPGTTVRYSVDEAFRLHLEAVLNHPAETVVRRPAFAREYVL
jgi:hypothetical protein